ncbi:MAG TPA: UbiA prenyltransferase family protein [Candidatus Didemnitutus sp.]|nr:UbiA prenyltransferase family protein [Candidatus Didemnitutus sp.]
MSNPPGQEIPVPASSGKPSLVRDLFKLTRPQQWTKNIYVLTPLVFGNLWLDRSSQIAIAVALACFCLWSSSVYCLNDVIDAEADRAHPRKKNRPVASGRISKPVALLLAVALLLGGAWVGYVCLPPGFIFAGALYVANNVLYCVFMKHRVIADVLVIAIGFVLRIEAGCLALGIVPSTWIHVCGFSLALVLGFGKRRLEVVNVSQPGHYRRVLHRYSAEKLNLFLGTSVSVCLVSYILYTVAPETIARHNTDRLFYTVPFVAYGLFRFMFKVQEGGYDGPDEVLVRDPIFALNGLAWIISVLVVLRLA